MSSRTAWRGTGKRTRSDSGQLLAINLNAFRVARFDLLLHMVHHRHGSNHNDGCDYLVWVKTGMEGSLPVQRLVTPTTLSFSNIRPFG